MREIHAYGEELGELTITVPPCYAKMELDVVGRTVLGVELDNLKSADRKRE